MTAKQGKVQVSSKFFLSLKAIGELTHRYYETIAPMIDFASGTMKDPQVKVLVDGTEFESWELSAAWDDFEPGLKHGNEFAEIASCGNRDDKQLPQNSVHGFFW